jgi:RecA/RadA recombinase
MAKPQGIRERIESGAEKSPAPAATYFTTGCTLLDLVVGGGRGKMGFKGGTLVNLVAIEAAGKTQLASESIAHNIHRTPGFWHQYIDREHRFSFDTQALWGVSVCDPAEWVPDTIEELDGYLGNLLEEAKTPGMIVVDSLDAFSTEETEQRAEKRSKQVDEGKDIKQDGSYTVSTGTPKFLSESLRIRMAQASTKNTCLLFLSQVRSKLGAMQFDPNKFIRNGGKALDHWCNDVVWLKPLRKLYVGKESDQSERVYGVVVKAWTTKNSTDRPFRECVYTILFDYGIDNIGSNVDFLFNLRNPKSGAFWGSDARSTDCKDDVCPLVIQWSEGKPKNLETVGAWLTETGRIEACKTDAKADKKQISMSYLEAWIARDPETVEDYRKAFPIYTRAELITAIEESEEMAAELERRTLEKWETFESMAASNRKRKF